MPRTRMPNSLYAYAQAAGKAPHPDPLFAPSRHVARRDFEFHHDQRGVTLGQEKPYDSEVAKTR
jgi:hypothetical protein